MHIFYCQINTQINKKRKKKAIVCLTGSSNKLRNYGFNTSNQEQIQSTLVEETIDQHDKSKRYCQ